MCLWNLGFSQWGKQMPFLTMCLRVLLINEAFPRDCHFNVVEKLSSFYDPDHDVIRSPLYNISSYGSQFWSSGQGIRPETRKLQT